MPKFEAYSQLAAPAAADRLLATDVSDTSMSAAGTTKWLTFSQLGPSDWFNITAYGAVGDGTTDNTTAIGNAITAAGSTGVVYIPPGTFLTGPLTISGNITIAGAGWSSVLKLKNASNGYVLTFSPGTGFITADIRSLAINGNAENQASGGCIYAAGSVQSRFDNIHFSDARDVCLYLYQNTSGGFGHHNRVTRCLFDTLNTVASATQQGIRLQSCDENYIAFNDFENWGGTSASPGSEPYAIKDWSGLQQIISNVFVGGQEAIRIQDSSSTRVIGNTFDGPGRAGVHASGSKNVIQGNLFSNGSGASAGASAQLEIDNSSSITVNGNVFAVTTSGQVRNCVYELSSSSYESVVTGNVIDLTGGSLFSTNAAIQLQGANSVARSNPGWNPVQALPAPAAPSLTPGTGGSMTAGTYQAKVTYVTTAGETAASAAASATVAASGTLVVAAPPPAGNARGWYGYVTQAGGSSFTRQQAAGAPSAFSSGLSLTANPTTSGAAAPSSNTTTGVTTPSVPATAVAVQNTTGADVMAYVTAAAGGTTAVAVGSAAAATVPASAVAAFRLPAGQYITLTYSSAPSWVWIGD